MITFEELNALVGTDDRRYIDIDEFFDEMFLSDEDISDRKEFTKELEDELFNALALLFLFLQFGTVTGVETVKGIVERAFLNTVNRFTQADSELTLYASTFSENFVDTAVKNAEKYKLFDDSEKKSTDDYRKTAYFFSQVRARLNAADSANAVFNHDEYRLQKTLGKTYKKWNTIRDGHERRTHGVVDGTIIPIDELFHVGDALMRYPHDIEMAGEFPEEIINCRCSAEYLTTEEFKAISRDS